MISTEEKLLKEKEQLEKALQEKNIFLAKIAHDLRFPLNGIIGFAELMYDGKLGDVSPEHKECLGDILLGANQVLTLVNEILDFIKIDAHKIQFNPEEIDFEKILKDTAHIFQKFITNRHIQFETSIDPSLKNICLDPLRLKQIIYNYVSNALKHTSDNGIVRVRVLPDKKNFLRLEVYDSGKGILQEDVDKLFVEFQQLDQEIAKKYPGAGLGLALTKRIVKAQGGEVGVESHPGQGSQFFAILPYTMSKDSSGRTRNVK